MNDITIYINELMQEAPGLAGVFLGLLSVLHPLIGGPLSVLIQTLWIGLMGSIWLGSLIMWGLNLIGIVLYYVLFQRFIESLTPWLSKKKKLQALLSWSEKKAPWQHVIALGLPFVYTYPLRITLVKPHGIIAFTMMLGTSYLILNGFNLLMIYTVFGTLTDALPVWVPISAFLGILITVYASKSSLDLR